MSFLSAQRRADALATFRTMRPDLDRLRSLPMPFLGAIEPAAAQQWLEEYPAAGRGAA
jgi:hypothetical protein